MNKRFDVCVCETNQDGKKFWNKVGVAFEGDKGVSLKLYMHPGMTLYLFDAKPKEPGKAGAGGAADYDKEIPF